jgi:hypothetical protein
MTKISETGHAKNVENFRRLYDHLMNFGGKYAPSDARLQTGNVSAVLQSASSSLTDLSVANPLFLQAVSRREAAFAGMPQLASRAQAIAEILHLNPSVVKATKELVRKLYGRRAIPKKIVPETPGAEVTEKEHKYISVSQFSFDQRIGHFSQFVEFLKADPAYQPAEADLNIAGLTARLDEMRASNNAVSQAGIPLANARNNRNAILYAPLTGLVDVALDVKKYVRAAMGATSGEYAEIKNLQFKRVK